MLIVRQNLRSATRPCASLLARDAAEWLEGILIFRSDKSARFLYGKVGREVLLNYEVHDSFRLCHYGIRGAKPNAIEQRVSIEQGFRFV